MKRKYQVAVILINYDSSSFTLKCVESIYKTSVKKKFQLIVVDNNSAIEDYKNIADLDRIYENLKIIKSRVNTGFSGGCMLGVQNSDADYYFFLNNDCVLLNDCIGILTDFLDTHPSVALCSPQLYNNKLERVISFDYRPEILSKILGNYYFKFTRRDSFLSRRLIINKPTEVEVLSGSQLFVRAADFERIGGFDTILFLYCEEEDLALRLWKIGCKIFLVPEAQNIHIGGASTLRNIAIEKEFLISFFYFYDKHYGKTKTYFIRLLYSIKYLRRAIRNKNNLSLVGFILFGARIKDSLRHKQLIK